MLGCSEAAAGQLIALPCVSLRQMLPAAPNQLPPCPSGLSRQLPTRASSAACHRLRQAGNATRGNCPMGVAPPGGPTRPRRVADPKEQDLEPA